MTADPGFTTSAMSAVFAAGNRVRMFCEFEGALAEAQAEAGEIPSAAAAAITRVCHQPVADPDSVLARGWEEGSPILVLLGDLRSRMSDEDGRSLHRGATSQDAIDTALMLQCREGLSRLDRSMASASSHLASLADRYRGTAVMGRTLLQPAVPTSFGVRAARWLGSVIRIRRDLMQLIPRLPVQMGGPVGDAASYGETAPALTEGVAARLGLAVPVGGPWHTDRWPVEEVAALVGRAAGVCAKIALDVGILAGEGEVRTRTGGSSSISGKRNPVDAIRAAAAAEVSRAAVAGVTAASPPALERAMGPWQAEWELVPLAFQAAGAAAEAIDRCLETLEVIEDGTALPPDAAPTGHDQLIDRILAEHHRMGEAG